jgi:hypothetical protein
VTRDANRAQGLFRRETRLYIPERPEVAPAIVPQHDRFTASEHLASRFGDA